MESRTTRFIDEDDNTFVIHAPANGAADTATKEEHHQLIVDHWPDLAAAGFLGFKRFGIGAVVVKQRDSQADAVEHDFEAHNVMYAPSDSAWMSDLDERTPADWLDAQFQSYDPNTTTVILFATGGERLRAYAVEGTPAPPRAFALSRAQYN